MGMEYMVRYSLVQEKQMIFDVWVQLIFRKQFIFTLYLY